MHILVSSAYLAFPPRVQCTFVSFVIVQFILFLGSEKISSHVDGTLYWYMLLQEISCEASEMPRLTLLLSSRRAWSGEAFEVER